ncbi:serine/threonine-protein kinase [Microseira wollei]|uniref:Serine/threonine kinase n=1 Tax=Microseira wollei NIES-4236 TaxID=2530354 RepID=A0AAV3X522_9CYAN|nr:serine/threonine-protein kinase [Microseira wollei]GET37922.1 serine/threonine kinase [Microseira wollei NIES-4236]
MQWQRGERLQDGKYTIRDVLGKGGFGITYRVRDLEGRQYVIKTLNEEAQASQYFDKLQQDFMNEALRLVQFKNHPHIVKVYQLLQERVQKNNLRNRLFNFGAPPSSFFLCCILMEYIEGTNLDDYVKKRGVLSEAEALGYIQQVGDALTAMHREGLLHRDVKPSNIILRASNSQAVLIDFGIAREFTQDLTMTHTQYCTPGFAPMEQYAPKAKRGEYTDVYALAATLYYLLTCTVPTFASDRALNAPLKPPTQINPNISDRVHEAIVKGLEFLPEKRPQSVQDWLKLLAPPPDNLRSAVGMDYQKLRDLLAAGKWKEADEETKRVMLKVGGHEQESWRLDTNRINQFPCEDLRTIDQLWVKYSNGRFGFSVQKRIWLEVGGKLWVDDTKVMQKFDDRVGWRVNGRVSGDLTYSPNAPWGHLPCHLWWNVWLGIFFSHAETCKL